MKDAHFLYELKFPDDKKYIGRSKVTRARNIHRWKEHEKNARNPKLSSPLYSAIKLHGFENVEKRILVYGEKKYIGELERKAIATFNTLVPHGYNVAHGGEWSPTEFPEVREKIRQSKLKHWQDPEYRKKISDKAKKYKYTDEQRRKNSESRKALWKNPEYRAKCIAAHVGVPPSQKGTKWSAETRARHAAAIQKRNLLKKANV